MSNILLINHYVSTPSTGIGGRTHYFARELARLGHDVTVVGARSHHLLREDVNSDELPFEEEIDGYRLLRLDVPRYKNSDDYRRILAWFVFSYKILGLRKKLKALPDVILYSSPQPIGYLGAERLARNFGARLVFEVRDIWPLTLIQAGGYSMRHPFIRFLQWIEDRSYARSEYVVSNLEGAVEHMAARGMDREKFVWVPNGLALDDAVRHVELPQEISAQIPCDGLRIVYAGTLGQTNSLDTLIDAAALLTNEINVHFLVLGQGSERAQLLAQRDALGLKNIHFLGVVPRSYVQSVLFTCDVCYIGLKASPLFMFGVSPNKIFDYFFAGKPVLHAIEAGKFNLVERHGAGITVPAQDPKMVADAIRSLYAMSEADRNLMGSCGRKAVVEQYAYAQLALRLERVLTG